MRGAASLLFAAILMALSTPIATAEPLYEGSQFPVIHSVADPEEYAWEVPLSEEQALRAVDDQHVEVYYTDSGVTAFTITAERAHDSEGAEVPTTIAITGPRVFTLTVHHRNGNPVAGGAPFAYPISPGAGWEGGFATVVLMPPADPSPPPSCRVPKLRDLSLRAARKKLKWANCALGPVRGERSRGARVVRQFRRPGNELPAGTAVGVKLGS